ncbi:hypothetical protein BKA82DRAFT_4354063 [Pisolithus tinctorius]|nr:hypothetical protein BKA82DRAFT_4354063 [Pisolithus tinctorius]
MGRARTTHVSRKTAPYDLRSRRPCSKQEDHQSSYSDCQPCISMVVPLQGYDNPEDFDSPPETSSPVQLEAFDALVFSGNVGYPVHPTIPNIPFSVVSRLQLLYPSDSRNFNRSRRAFNLQQTFPPALSSIWRVKEKEEDLSIPSTHPTDCATLEMQYTVPKQEDPQTLLLLQQLWSYYPSSPMMLEAESSTSAKRQEHYIPPAVPIPLSSLTDPTTGKIIVDAVEMHAFAVAYNHMLDAMRDVERVARHALGA